MSSLLVYYLRKFFIEAKPSGSAALAPLQLHFGFYSPLNRLSPSTGYAATCGTDPSKGHDTMKQRSGFVKEATGGG
ncbi:MAG: hypothetical protein NXH85_11235 [Pseudomonadaceae bacterium]|nr:hypothetical protein [Pseudomonadaceae bacterium]